METGLPAMNRRHSAKPGAFPALANRSAVVGSAAAFRGFRCASPTAIHGEPRRGSGERSSACFHSTIGCSHLDHRAQSTEHRALKTKNSTMRRTAVILLTTVAVASAAPNYNDDVLPLF